MNKQRLWSMLAVFLLATALLPHQIQAVGDSPAVQKLLADDGVAGDLFGGNVSISGDTAVIGASRDDDKGKDSGSAYVFVRAADGTWKQQAKLTAEDGAAEDEFGNRISISGDTALIGTKSGIETKHDAIYVFVRAADGTWSQQAKLIPPPESDWGLTSFRRSISLSGDTALIGAIQYKDSLFGSAYVFVRAADGTWKQQAKLREIPSLFGDSNWFGESVSISGDTALIGVPGASGSAYVFTRSTDGTWSQQAELTPADSSDTYWFGESVSIFGDTAFIGAKVRNKDESSNVYVFVRTGNGTWQKQAKLTFTEDKPESAQRKFLDISVSHDMAVIKVNKETMLGTFGTVYIFARTGDGTWKQQSKLTTHSRYTSSVSISGDTAVIGDSGGLEVFQNSRIGAVYVYGPAKAKDKP